ncbi:MAG: T9SS type A sorting domain-containing protein [Bacteroidota bacterium]
MAGQFNGTRTFGSTALSSSGSSDLLVAKFDPAGNFLWAVKGGATQSVAAATGLTLADGNVVVTGYFTGNLAMGNLTVSNGGSAYKEIFIAALDTATGTCIWLNNIGGQFDDFSSGLTPATGGGFYICGNFRASIGLGNDTLTTTSFLDPDAFYAKFDQNGNCIWGREVGGFGTEETGGIKEINANEIVMNGSFEGSILLGNNQTITSVAVSDFMLIKFDSQGNVIWGKSGGSTNTDQGFALDTDAQGNIYSTGIIGATATFGTVNISNNQNLNMFIAKHNASGVCQWVKMAGDILDDMGLDIATDAAGSSYVTGYVSGNPTFGTTPFPGVVAKEAYVAKYNTLGTLIWVARIGGGGIDRGKSIVLTGNGSAVVAGEFDQNITVGSNTITAVTGGDFTSFLVKLEGGTVGIGEPTLYPIGFYPNPTRSELFVTSDAFATNQIASVSLTDIMGRLVLQLESTDLNTVSNGIRMDVSALPSGTYNLSITQDNGAMQHRKVLIVD